MLDRMSLEKIQPLKVTMLSEGIIVIPVCCLVMLFEVIPMSNTTVVIGTAYNTNNSIDTLATTMFKRALSYQQKFSDEHNIGYVSSIQSFSEFKSGSTGNSSQRNSDQNGNRSSIKRTHRSGISSSAPGNTFDTSKLVHSSFRLEQHIIKSLEKVAARRDISLSALVNKILKNYVTSEMYFEELGFLLVSKNFLRRTFEVLDQNHIAELGREYGLTMAKEYVSYFYPQVNSYTLVQFLEIWFRRFQSCQHRIDEADHNLHYFMVNHDINLSFSLVLQSTLEGLIEPIIMGTIEFTNVTPSTITFSFRV
jgi:hypothetical protein